MKLEPGQIEHTVLNRDGYEAFMAATIEEMSFLREFVGGKKLEPEQEHLPDLYALRILNAIGTLDQLYRRDGRKPLDEVRG